MTSAGINKSEQTHQNSLLFYRIPQKTKIFLPPLQSFFCNKKIQKFLKIINLKHSKIFKVSCNFAKVVICKLKKI